MIAAASTWAPRTAGRPQLSIALRPGMRANTSTAATCVVVRARQQLQPSGAEAVKAAALPSRRRLLVETSLLSSLLLAAPACAGEEALESAAGAAAGGNTKVFFDFTVDGKPAGKVVVEVYGDVAVGGQRFMDLAKGKQGVGYRRSKVDALEQAFIRLDGVSVLSYDSSGVSPIAGGEDTFKLEEEMATATHGHDAPGTVSLLVKNPNQREAKTRLVAVNGKLVNITEDPGDAPNGTGFAITTQAAPELDSTNLVVGRVVQGMDIVQTIAALPAVKDNTMSPYFKAAKAIGDKRADVAEKGFKRPYSKIVVAKSGLLP
mmetsp:Transcript_39097/g.99040  ORF Transcript_39097/g.99040 Transcript_39097/m.99040 type:complete len:318 (-) Transcript_39097:587-1540(-)